MHPGDAVIHHPLTVHGSGGNETSVVADLALLRRE
jgi:ectoine hydroxylase-related dioxygenase (phytanoyl-CoA dioxygenase family)